MAGILVLAFPQIGIPTLIILLAVGLLFLGISRIGTSLGKPGLPGWLRALGIVTGLLALILWLLALVLPALGVALLLAILAVGLIFHGFDRVTVDGMNQGAPGWVRGFSVVVGVLLIIFGILVLLFPAGFGLLTAVVFVSIALVTGGLSTIVAGIAGLPQSRMAPRPS